LPACALLLSPTARQIGVLGTFCGARVSVQWTSMLPDALLLREPMRSTQSSAPCHYISGISLAIFTRHRRGCVSVMAEHRISHFAVMVK
jgi:hypothetical protein